MRLITVIIVSTYQGISKLSLQLVSQWKLGAWGNAKMLQSITSSYEEYNRQEHASNKMATMSKMENKTKYSIET